MFRRFCTDLSTDISPRQRFAGLGFLGLRQNYPHGAANLIPCRQLGLEFQKIGDMRITTVYPQIHAQGCASAYPKNYPQLFWVLLRLVDADCCDINAP